MHPAFAATVFALLASTALVVGDHVVSPLCSVHTDKKMCTLSGTFTYTKETAAENVYNIRAWDLDCQEIGNSWMPEDGS